MKNTIKLITTITGGKKLILSLFLVGQFIPANCQTNEENIQKTILAFFDGFTKADTSIIFKSIDKKNFSLQTVLEKNGKTQIHNEQLIDFIEVITTPKKEKWIENIESFNIKIDGNFANAWCKYTFFVDTTFYHWGIDNFQLVKAGGRWKIFSIADTRNNKESYTKGEWLNVDEDDISMIANETIEEEINYILDNWHKAAATGDEKIFFGSMDSSCIYLGTDKTEHWTKQEFEKWSKKYFDQNKGWDFTPYDRHIYFGKDRKCIWFDELLKTWMGISRGSGVFEYQNGKFKLMQYNLAVTIPNEKMKEFVKINK